MGRRLSTLLLLAMVADFQIANQMGFLIWGRWMLLQVAMDGDERRLLAVGENGEGKQIGGKGSDDDRSSWAGSRINPLPLCGVVWGFLPDGDETECHGRSRPLAAACESMGGAIVPAVLLGFWICNRMGFLA
ncbi:hypothetical protein ACLOJK_015036, partial [Asimina triloba]